MSCNMNVNPKLLHLVQKALAQVQADATAGNMTSAAPHMATSSALVQSVLECLCSNNLEYQRKNRDKLMKQTQAAIQILLQQQKSQQPNSAQPGKEHASEEEREEELARQHDAYRQQMASATATKSPTKSLNSSLRKAYAQANQVNSSKNNPHSGDTNTCTDTTAATTSCDTTSATTDNIPSRKRKLSERRKSKSSSKRTTKNGDSSYADQRDSAYGDNDETFWRPAPRPTERYSNLGGLNATLQQIKELVEYPLLRPEVYTHLGVQPPRGILLRGPPGCGKSHLANAIAGELGNIAAYFKVSAPELVAGMSGESERRIRDLFQAAADAAPAIVFLDELDAIAPKRNDGASGRGMEKRMVAQLLTSMDSTLNEASAPVIVLGATNRPDALDSALRRAGRFDQEIALGVPDEAARKCIIQTMTRGMRLDGDFDFGVLAKKTPGFVGADIRSLTKEAAVLAVNRIFRNVLSGADTAIGIDAEETPLQQQPKVSAIADDEPGNPSDNGTAITTTIYSEDPNNEVRKLLPLTSEQLEPLYVTMDDFLKAVPRVQPSGKREGFAVVPDVTWDDIGAMHEIREEITMSVLEPIRHPEKFKMLGLCLPAGVLLYGPPGCGKTLLAKAIANESGANFISVKGPELLDKYVGESERAVRLVFERARSSSPCIVFFDELDSLCPKRGSSGEGGSGVSERVVNQLLTEMDGLESRRSVFVIAATNRPELIGESVLCIPFIRHMFVVSFALASSNLFHCVTRPCNDETVSGWDGFGDRILLLSYLTLIFSLKL
jgi:ribosome biogenesis ATPase